MNDSVPAEQAYAEDVTDLHKAQRMIAQMRRAVRQRTELTYVYDLLPQQQQWCVLPELRG